MERGDGVGLLIVELLERMIRAEPKIRGRGFAVYSNKEVLEIADEVARRFGFEIRSTSYVLAAYTLGWLHVQLRDEQIDSNASFYIREIDNELRFGSLTSKVRGALPPEARVAYFTLAHRLADS